MGDAEQPGDEQLLERIRSQARSEQVLVTLHAQQEMLDENVALGDVLEAIGTSEILENYPQHQRGACCLLCGATRAGRWLHVVCTAARPALIIITVYEPKPPKWVTPTMRRPRP